MDEIMAEQKQQEELQKENEVLDKKQLKAAKKLEKKKRKQKNPDDLNSANSDAGYIAQLEEKAKELDTYKQNEADFEKEKEKWYEDVVFSEDAPDISNYKEYYESIDAANAEVLYKQVVEQTLTDEQMDDYVKTYSSMKPKEAAAIFDTMTDNLQLVADILSNMDTQSRGDILGKMNSDTAAKVTEIMEPSE